MKYNNSIAQLTGRSQTTLYNDESELWTCQFYWHTNQINPSTGDSLNLFSTELDVQLNLSKDQNLNAKVSANDITESKNIRNSLYPGGYGAMSVVAKRRNDPINSALIQNTQTYRRKLEEKQNVKRNLPIFDLLDEGMKNIIIKRGLKKILSFY